ncbi:Sporulation related domain protein [compost metagenome]
MAQAFFEQRGYGVSVDPNPPVEYASVSDEDGEGIGSTAVAYVSGPPPASLPTEVTPPPSARAAPAPRAATPRATAPVQRAEARTPENLTASLNGGSSSSTRRASSAATPARASTREAARAPAGRWTVQVGAFRDEAVARNWLNDVSRRFRSQFTDAQRDVQNADGWYRSRFTGMTQASAEAACEALGERRVTCMVIRPS